MFPVSPLTLMVHFIALAAFLADYRAAHTYRHHFAIIDRRIAPIRPGDHQIAGLKY